MGYNLEDEGKSFKSKFIFKWLDQCKNKYFCLNMNSNELFQNYFIYFVSRQTVIICKY